MELKKSYKGFAIWMICFCVACLAIGLLPLQLGAAGAVRLIGNVCTIGMAVLTFIIYKTGYVYWYTGISYEEAVRAGEERRKICAWEHFKRFGIFAIIIFLLSIITHFLKISFWFDFTVLTVGLIAVAISTIWIKL